MMAQVAMNAVKHRHPTADETPSETQGRQANSQWHKDVRTHSDLLLASTSLFQGNSTLGKHLKRSLGGKVYGI